MSDDDELIPGPLRTPPRLSSRLLCKHASQPQHIIDMPDLADDASETRLSRVPNFRRHRRS